MSRHVTSRPVLIISFCGFDLDRGRWAGARRTCMVTIYRCRLLAHVQRECYIQYTTYLCTQVCIREGERGPETEGRKKGSRGKRKDTKGDSDPERIPNPRPHDDMERDERWDKTFGRTFVTVCKLLMYIHSMRIVHYYHPSHITNFSRWLFIYCARKE